MTDKQKQHLLAYLGFYDGMVDGKFGKKSKRATRDFQLMNYNLEVDGSCGPATQAQLKAIVGETAEYSPVFYITQDLFKCKCGGKGCNGFPVEVDWQLLRYLDRIIVKCNGADFRISSGLRCKTLNKAVGGSKNSCHMKGKAVDFAIIGKSGKATLAMVKEIVGDDLHSAYIIENNWIHMCVK